MAASAYAPPHIPKQDSSLRLNATYYIRKQIIPPVCNVLL